MKGNSAYSGHLFSLFNQYQSCFAETLLPSKTALILGVLHLCHFTHGPCATALRRQQPAARAPKASGPSLLDYKQGADAAPTVPELRHCTLYSASWLWNHTSTGTPQGRVASTTELLMTMGQKQPGSDQLFRSKRRLFLSVRHVLFQPSPWLEGYFIFWQISIWGENTKCGGVHTHTINLEV